MIQGIEQGVKLFTLVTIPEGLDIRSKRKDFSRTRKIALFNSQKGQCIFCECQMTKKKKNNQFPANFATVEHVVPLQKGGTNNEDNLVMSCLDCNNQRGTMDFIKFAHLRNSPELWAVVLKAREDSIKMKEAGRKIHERNLERSKRNKIKKFNNVLKHYGNKVYMGPEIQTVH